MVSCSRVVAVVIVAFVFLMMALHHQVVNPDRLLDWQDLLRLKASVLDRPALMRLRCLNGNDVHNSGARAGGGN